MKRWLHPDGVERTYNAILQGYVSTVSKETIRQLKARQLLHVDSWSDDLTALFLELLAWALGEGETVIGRLPEVYAAVSIFNDKQFRLVVKAGTGLSLPESGQPPIGAKTYGNVSEPGLIRARFGVGVDVYRSEPWLAERQANWIAQNTQLIKSIPEQYMTQVQSLVRHGVMEGLSPKALADALAEQTGIPSRRAKIIARDQIGKANAELTQYRQEEIGVTEYTWVTSHDERVRGNPYGKYPRAVPSHYDRDEKVFEWKKPPEGGHPGIAVLCRCYAEPVFPDVSESTDSPNTDAT